MEMAVMAVIADPATVAFAVTVWSSWPKPPKPVRALYAWKRPGLVSAANLLSIHITRTHTRTAVADHADHIDLVPRASDGKFEC